MPTSRPLDCVSGVAPEGNHLPLIAPNQSISSYTFPYLQINVINARFKNPPLPRGGGSVCRDGGVFNGIGITRVKERLGSAENPSVSLREPPSLRREGAFFTANFTALGLVHQDMPPRETSSSERPNQRLVILPPTSRSNR